ncbi:hypothetical protein V5740_00235 [Croceibacterium sp. TMG7-5b_MA50]|uniref:hypothetical protein n=1 Tax=Croceibacterium sp. TMG7-5b_MA50 TaxID=3121290 RepID=UPI00322149E3
METAAAQMPWDRIIAAAASSPLGVVSLVTLVAGFVAVLLFRDAGERTRLLVFGALVLGLAGVVGAVLRERSEAVPIHAGPDDGPTDTPTDTPDTLADTGADDAAADDTKLSPVDEEPVQPAIVQIAGDWRDADGATYRIEQDGAAVTIQGFAMGQLVAQGDGQVDGRQLRYSFINAIHGSRGDCTGRIAADAQEISGRCDTTMGPMLFTVRR